MTYELVYRVGLGNAQSPFRIVAQPGAREVAWVNFFLDQCMVRGLAWHTLRGYAFSLTLRRREFCAFDIFRRERSKLPEAADCRHLFGGGSVESDAPLAGLARFVEAFAEDDERRVAVVARDFFY